MGGRGSKAPAGGDKRNGYGATRTLGNAGSVPQREDIESGNAEYGGIPLRYHPEIDNEASNYTTEIWIGKKFFDYPKETQQHILNHEVAHNWSDEMMAQHSGDWNTFASKFIQEKEVPKSSAAYQQGRRTYFEGLYGDIGGTALSETTTRAITEYLDNPQRLRERSEAAYREVDRFVKRKLK